MPISLYEEIKLYVSIPRSFFMDEVGVPNAEPPPPVALPSSRALIQPNVSCKNKSVQASSGKRRERVLKLRWKNGEHSRRLI
jgi:hypothetical protein